MLLCGLLSLFSINKSRGAKHSVQHKAPKLHVSCSDVDTTSAAHIFRSKYPLPHNSHSLPATLAPFHRLQPHTEHKWQLQHLEECMFPKRKGGMTNSEFCTTEEELTFCECMVDRGKMKIVLIMNT